MSWWEYKAPSAWVHHLIGTGHDTDVGGVAVDVDGDGWVDQISGNSWYRNLKNGSFERHVFGGIRCHDTRAGDLDGDGKPEVVSLNDGALVIYRISANPARRHETLPLELTMVVRQSSFGTRSGNDS